MNKTSTISWDGPGFYRQVRQSSIDDLAICEWQKVADYDDTKEGDYQRWKATQHGRRVIQARTQKDLPTNEE